MKNDNASKGINLNPLTGLIGLTNDVAQGIGKGLKQVGNLVFDSDSEESDDSGIDKESATAHKKEFMAKYGIKCQIPSLYVQQAIYYKRDPQYKIQLVNYVFPKGEDYKVKTHFLNGE